MLQSHVELLDAEGLNLKEVLEIVEKLPHLQHLLEHLTLYIDLLGGRFHWKVDCSVQQGNRFYV